LPDGQRIRTLADLIKKGPLPEEQILSIFSQVLEAVAYAHNLGILHLDLKPSNILFTPNGEVKVTDFGIARIVSGERQGLVSEIRVGTIPYMSPEQILNKKLDKRSDIYSLGITFYEMATGEVPFKRTEASSVEEQHLFSPPPKMREKNPKIPAHWEIIIAKALAKKPEERFQNCEEFLSALTQPAIEKPPIVEKPKTIACPSLVGKTKKEAESIVATMNLNLIVEGEESSEITPQGLILWQTPEPKTLLGEGEAIKIIVSKGKVVKPIPVPLLIGKGKEEAERLLAPLGLKLKIEGEDFSETIPTNAVINQNPAVGTEVKSGEVIKVILSKGKKPPVVKIVKIPPLTGKSRSEAEKIIADLGLKLLVEKEDYSETITEGCILKQTPEPNAQLKEGETVKVILSKGKKLVSCPNLIGKTKTEAEAEAKRNRLGVIVDGEEYSEKMPEGAILKQSPEPNTQLKEGETIKIRLSKGLPLIKVPDLTEKTEGEAIKILYPLGLKLTVEGEDYSENIPLGRVLRQSPLPNEFLRKGEVIKVVLSKGEKPIVVPNLIGKEKKEAEKILTNLGLKLKIEREDFSENIPANNILNQNPAGGTEVKSGEVVKVILSKGKKPPVVKIVNVPLLTGKTRLEAENLLKNLGLKLLVENQDYSETVEEGCILKQSPPAETQLKEGESVKVTLSKGLPLIKVPNLTEKTEGEAIKILYPLGLKLAVEGEDYSETIPMGKILRQSPLPNESLRKGEVVKAVLSKGKKPPVVKIIKVPPLVGKKREEVEKIVANLNLRLIVEEEYSERFPVGIIFKQIPESGTELKEGEVIKVIESKGPELIKVPLLIGEDKKSAEKILSSLELKLLVEGEEFSENFPLGSIIKQTPAAGEKLKPGEKVRVIISKGKKLIKAPPLIDKTLPEAEKIVSQLGLKLATEGWEYSNLIPKGKIIKQSPEPEEPVVNGLVRVVLSKGKEPIKSPNLIGKTIIEAEKELTKLGLKLVLEWEDFSEKIPKDCILSQTPDPGEELSEGSAIRVILSKGKKPIERKIIVVPSLLGKKRKEAEKIIWDLNLKLIIAGEEYSETYAQNTISQQSPLPGETLKEGEVVKVILSKGKEVIPVKEEKVKVTYPKIKKLPKIPKTALIGLGIVLVLALSLFLVLSSRPKPKRPSYAGTVKPETTISETVPTETLAKLVEERIEPETLARRPRAETLARRTETIPAVKPKPETVVSQPPVETTPSPKEETAPEIVPYAKVEIKPNPISIPKPEYPEMARRAKIEGQTIVKVLVDIDGSVIDAQILKSSGNDALDEAALVAARQAKFSPAKQKDMPVKVWVSIPFNFYLKR
ncbi:MAG: TonB family protein, partial [candidate division WOR-3 bacterium]